MTFSRFTIYFFICIPLLVKDIKKTILLNIFMQLIDNEISVCIIIASLSKLKLKKVKKMWLL